MVELMKRSWFIKKNSRFKWN